MKRGLLRSAALAAFMVSASLGASLPGWAAQTLQFSTWQAEEGGFGVFWGEVVAAFEKAHPDIDISVVQIPYSEYVNQMTIRFASGQAPQIIQLPYEFLGVFAAQDWFDALDDKIKGSVVDTDWSSLQSEMNWNGKTVGVLMTSGAVVLFYNEKLLADAGIALPTSYDEYMAALPKLTDRDKGIFGVSAVTAQHPTIAHEFMRTIHWSGQQLIKDGQYNLTDPAVIAAFERYRTTIKASAALGFNSSMSRQAFADGKSAFMIDGPWVYSIIATAPEDVRPHLKIMKPPFPVALGGAAQSLHIAAGLDPETRDAAWSFIEFLTRKEWQERWTVLTTAPTGLNGVLTPELAKEYPQLEVVNAASEGVRPTFPSDTGIRSNLNEFTQILMRSGVRLLSTEDPTADVLAETQAELERTFPLE